MGKKESVIMVIEDEKLLLEAIERKLKNEKLETISCRNAEQALDYLKNFTTYPDLIWLDYHLTGMDGLSFVGELKKNEKWSKIPIVVVSNSASAEKVHNMLALGIKKYLLKAEYRLDEIVEILQEIIENKCTVND